MKAITTAVFAFSLLLLSACGKKKETPAPTPGPDASAALDMRYNVTGTMTDYSNSTYTGLYPFEITLEKAGIGQGTMVPKQLGIPGHLILIGSSTSYYGSFGIVVTFDLTTNKIASITNHYGQPAPNGRSATLDPSGVNAWNPTTKEIKIKYWLDDSTLSLPHRASFDETWTYLGAK